jgi:hypothetical protein
VAATRTLPFEPADFLRSIVPLGLLSVAAALPPLRLPLLLVLAVGAGVAVARDAPVRWTWAGAVPVAVSLFWGTLSAPQVAGVSECENPASPVATWRGLEAVVVLVALAIVALLVRAVRGRCTCAGRPGGGSAGQSSGSWSPARWRSSSARTLPGRSSARSST